MEAGKPRTCAVRRRRHTRRVQSFQLGSPGGRFMSRALASCWQPPFPLVAVIAYKRAMNVKQLSFLSEFLLKVGPPTHNDKLSPFDPSVGLWMSKPGAGSIFLTKEETAPYRQFPICLLLRASTESFPVAEQSAMSRTQSSLPSTPLRRIQAYLKPRSRWRWNNSRPSSVRRWTTHVTFRFSVLRPTDCLRCSDQ